MQRHEVLALVAATLMGAQNSLVSGRVVREPGQMDAQLGQAEELLRKAEELQRRREREAREQADAGAVLVGSCPTS